MMKAETKSRALSQAAPDPGSSLSSASALATQASFQLYARSMRMI